MCTFREKLISCWCCAVVKTIPNINLVFTCRNTNNLLYLLKVQILMPFSFFFLFFHLTSLLYRLAQKLKLPVLMLYFNLNIQQDVDTLKHG